MLSAFVAYIGPGPGLSMLGALIGLVVGGLLYFVPLAVAWFRGHKNAVAITALNLLAGWTFLGWIGALVWALTENTSD